MNDPDQVLQPIHLRKPVILAPEDFRLWLDPGGEGTRAL
jgi:putative SOS response-associated peptidase YedK